MRSIFIYSICLYFLFFLSSCLKEPNYPKEPVIVFKSFSKNEVLANVDTTLLVISFTDGDGDLGLEDDEPGSNVEYIDTRTGFVNTARIPYIPSQGVSSSIAGEISIALRATSCIPSFPPKQEEELEYKVRIRDRAGNWSNEITSSVLTLLCD